MKKFYLRLMLIVAVITTHMVSAQQANDCSVAISGDTCAGSYITAHYTGERSADTLKWQLNGKVIQVRAANTFKDSGITAADNLDLPDGLFVDDSGNIYVADWGNHRVQKWKPGAKKGITVAGGNGEGSAPNQLSYPSGVSLDDSGNVYVSTNRDRVVKWPPGATSGITVAGGNGQGPGSNQFDIPQGIYVDRHGNIFVADSWNNRVEKWKPGATKGVAFAGGKTRGSAPDQLDFPVDVCGDDSGNIYIADQGNERIQKWAPGAAYGITVAGGNSYGSAPNQFLIPRGVSIDSAGNVYVADDVNNRIQKWAPGAKYGVTVAGGNDNSGSGSKELNSPEAVFIGASGSLYVSDGYNARVQKFDPVKKINTDYQAPEAGDYRVTAISKNGCTARSEIFHVGDVPPKPYITGPSSVKKNQKGLIFTVEEKSERKYKWGVPDGCTIVSGQGTDSIVVNWNSTNGYVQVRAKNACGFSGFSSKKYVNVTSSTYQLQQESSFTTNDIIVYPNPVVDKVWVEVNAHKQNNYTISLSDVTGRILLHKAYTATPGLNRIGIDMSPFTPGVYFISVSDAENGKRSFTIKKN